MPPELGVSVMTATTSIERTCPPNGFGKSARTSRFIEFSAENTLTGGAWKALRELTHILDDHGPIRRRQDLVAQFLGAKQPHSMARYILLIEAIATASQLLAFERLNVQM